jgi:trimethylamine--corrinoid protein Co-methyltransferase
VITANYAASGAPRLRILSDEQCRELTLASLECLERIGVEVGNAEARELLAAAGATLDGTRVRIPAHVIRDAIASTPPAFTVWGRGEQPMRVTNDRVHYGPGLTSTYFIDPETGERRPSRRGDPALTARVADALTNIDYVMGLGLIGDVDAELASVYEFAEMLANTGKPIIAWAHRASNLVAMARMAAAVAGSEEALRQRPIFALFATYPSPLRHTDEDLGNAIWAARHGVPVVYLGGPTVGIESPFSSASALVLHQAAALSGLAVIQLARRGAPAAIGGLPSPMDLRTARPSYGSPESVLHSAACAELARYLGVPFMGTAGASESKLIDAQAGLESMMQTLMAALSGASLVHDAGFLDCADIGSLSMLILTDEIIGMVKRLMRGIEVNRGTIMLDLIEKVGPGRHFLDEPESAALSRREVWMPTVLDRNQHALWEQAGAKDTAQRVNEKLRKILAKHQPPALTATQSAAIESILADAHAHAVVEAYATAAQA